VHKIHVDIRYMYGLEHKKSNQPPKIAILIFLHLLDCLLTLIFNLLIWQNSGESKKKYEIFEVTI